MGVSESVQTIPPGTNQRFAVRDFRPDRNHMRDQALVARESRFGAAEIGLSVSVTAPPAFNQTATFKRLGAPLVEALGLGTPGFSISGAPPDTTLAVSPMQILQWVNSQCAVHDKASVPLLPTPGLQDYSIRAGLPAGSLCRTFNRGDPIVQYDQINNRWILSQFAFNNSFANNAQCIAVSQTNNAMGAYNLVRVQLRIRITLCM